MLKYGYNLSGVTFMQLDNHFQRKSLILNMINHLGPVSRTALIEYTAYRPATVGALVTELLDENLIVETGFHSNGQGRKRALLEINKEHICAIGIYFSAKHITYIFSQFDGKVLQRSRTKYSPEKNKALLVAEVSDYVREMLSEFPSKKVVGIGICKPLVDPLSYKISNSQSHNSEFFAHWIQDDLSSTLKKEFNLHVDVFSGVTLPAQAEYTFGVAKGVSNFIWVELSNGIGASIFCNGDAVRGINGIAGELGHTNVGASDPNAKLCYCGKPGCVETLAAWPAIKENIVRELRRGVISTLNNKRDTPEEITVDDVRVAIEADDRMCKHYVKKAAEHIGLAIANAVTLLNPKMIVLYGFMLDLGDFFLEHLERTVRENVMFLASDFEIRTSIASESILPLGATANIFYAYLQCSDYKWVYRLKPEDVDLYEANNSISEAPFMY